MVIVGNITCPKCGLNGDINIPKEIPKGQQIGTSCTKCKFIVLVFREREEDGD